MAVLLIDQAHMSGILPAMTTVTVRELQKNLKRALVRVERGETLQITRRKRTVARLSPAPQPTKPAAWPDLAARAALLSAGKPFKGSPAADVVIESR